MIGEKDKAGKEGGLDYTNIKCKTSKCNIQKSLQENIDEAPNPPETFIREDERRRGRRNRCKSGHI